MKTEHGDELEIVEEPLPEQFDPEREPKRDPVQGAEADHSS
jgi:hypothetical protein